MYSARQGRIDSFNHVNKGFILRYEGWASLVIECIKNGQNNIPFDEILLFEKTINEVM